MGCFAAWVTSFSVNKRWWGFQEGTLGQHHLGGGGSQKPLQLSFYMRQIGVCWQQLSVTQFFLAMDSIALFIFAMHAWYVCLSVVPLGAGTHWRSRCIQLLKGSISIQVSNVIEGLVEVSKLSAMTMNSNSLNKCTSRLTSSAAEFIADAKHQ